MARIPYVDPDSAPDPVREALAALPPLNIFKMLANAETAFRPFLRFGGAVLGSLELDPQLRELAILQVAKQTEARYEWIQHAEIGRRCGLTDEQIAAVESGSAAESRALDEAQRAVLAFTEAVVGGPRLDDDEFAAVSRHLSGREIVELLLTIGDYWMLARVMTVLELELDEAMGGQVIDSSGARREPRP
jgi:alkylhydroperoxidase family enzyme